MRKIEQKRLKPRQLENLLDCNFRKAHRIKFITNCNSDGIVDNFKEGKAERKGAKDPHTW